MGNYDDFELAVATMSGGKNVVKYINGLPSVMVPVPKFKISDVISGASQNTHPGFIVNGVEKGTVYVSKFQNIVVGDRAYSLPGRDPKVNINFDQAVQYCRNNGRGWSLMPYSLWAAIALWCRKNGTMPHGNNNFGQDASYPQEKGIPIGAKTAEGEPQHIATGSGPATWYHNWMPDGIADLNGNVSEWCAGLRSVNGELQIIPYANVFDPDVSLASASTSWKGIAADGSLVDPGTSGDLHYDFVSGKVQLSTKTSSTADAWDSCSYEQMTLASGLTAPEIAKALILYPDEPGKDYASDYHGYNPNGECMSGCGGNFGSTGDAGVFGVRVVFTRGSLDFSIGFRSAFADLDS